MNGFTLIVSNKKEELLYKEVIEQPRQVPIENVAIMIIPPGKSEYESPTILTDTINYYGRRAVNNFLFNLK